MVIAGQTNDLNHYQMKHLYEQMIAQAADFSAQPFIGSLVIYICRLHETDTLQQCPSSQHIHQLLHISALTASISIKLYPVRQAANVDSITRAKF